MRCNGFDNNIGDIEDLEEDNNEKDDNKEDHNKEDNKRNKGDFFYV